MSFYNKQHNFPPEIMIRFPDFPVILTIPFLGEHWKKIFRFFPSHQIKYLKVSTVHLQAHHIFGQFIFLFIPACHSRATT